MLPNLLVIGAAKAGTSSLHVYLDEHPDISMSWPKELFYFSFEDWRERRAWYERFFRDAPVRGESCPQYAMHPAFPDVSRRVHSLIPDARLIYLVRDPVERFVAHYVDNIKLALERRPLDEVLALDDGANYFLAASRYATQLERFLACFDQSRILVLDQRDLLHRRAETMRSVFAFLGVDPDFTSPAFSRELNAHVDKPGLSRFGHWAYTSERLPARVRSLVVRHGGRLLTRRVPIPRLSDPQRERLLEHLAPEAERLRALTGQPFAGWSV